MKIYILSTSDTHGWILPTNFVGNNQAPFGLSRAKTAIEEFKNAHPDDVIFTVDNGDFIQGSPMTNYIARDHREFVGVYEELANQMQYDIRTLGNHEFNYGSEYTKLAIPESNNILTANIHKNGNNFYENSYKIIERKGVKVGFIGLTTEYIPHWEKESNVSNMEFQNPVEIAKKLVPIVREQSDFVIVMYHAGLEYDSNTGEATEVITGENRGYELINSVPGIDALVTGHQHRHIAQLINTPFGDVPVTQPGQKAEEIGVISIDINSKEAQAKLILTKDFSPNLKMIKSIEKIQTGLNEYLDTKIGEFDKDYLFINHFKARKESHPIIDLVNKVQGKAVNASISANAIFNDDLPGFKKEITRRDLVVNYLYPNTAVAELVSGAELLAALEQSASFFVIENGKITVNKKFLEPKKQLYNYDIYSGIDYELKIENPIGSRVVKASFNGHSIAPDKKYKVALSSYRSGGTGNYSMYNSKKIIEENPKDIIELLEEFIVENTPIKLKVPNNLKVK
ncbi:MAG: bifunctional metallophosphatase/5'-nucleotidase [Lactobacillaceae bacterium]|jgi:2',3'-cyclic-nucleotide 2'-phosphodiesterase/3'-nucleotidase|nr:bifunctional metallophosphatase/5'-nucleotidase [Lactobacillaceae bacterium]